MNRRDRRLEERNSRKIDTLIRHGHEVILAGGLQFSAYFTKSRKKARR